MKRKTERPRRTQKSSQGSNYEITGVALFLFGLFVLFSLFSDNTGTFGSISNTGTHFLLGVGAPLGALLMMGFGGHYAVTSRGISWNRRVALVILLVMLLLATLHHFAVPFGEEMEVSAILTYGGIIGAGFCSLFHEILGFWGTTILLFGALLSDVLLLTRWSLSAGAQKVGSKAQVLGKKTEQKFEDVAAKIREKKAERDAARSAARLEVIEEKPTEFIYKKNTEKEETPQDIEPSVERPEPIPEPVEEAPVEEMEIPAAIEEEAPTNEEAPVEEAVEVEIDTPEAPAVEDEIPPEPPMPEEELSEELSDAPLEDPISEDIPEEPPAAEEPIETEEPEMIDEPVEEPEPVETEEPPQVPAAAIAAPAPPVPEVPQYQFPPLSLLHAGKSGGSGSTDTAQKASLIETTLNSFGVHAKVIHYSVGPTVTRFELKPEMGVRVSKIEGLSNELAMALEATHIRIEAPIPGKSAVGIEIPNTKAASVPLHDVLASDEFQLGKGHILVALGKDITGKTVVTDLAKAPHLLIAGSTGSGKSVCINSIITSIIYHSRPDEVKLMLIDPKVVELSVYNGIPHLRTEVVTDMKKAQGTLNWAVREMEARYQLFAGARVRNIEGYNKANPDKKMPYILIIVDEFADLMNVAAKEVEVLIQRLTQKARAAGIHLILATQRPSADVITGVIKSNIPSRIAFMVESGLNSRIILDEGGAESLLGKGDMLFKQAGALSTVRIQGAFISDEEVEDVVNYVRNECLKQEAVVTYEPIDLSIPEKTDNPEDMDEEKDDLLPEAAEWVLDTKRPSVSALQRRFRIGYTRAGRLMDHMQRLGIVGPAEGTKPREILMEKSQLAAVLKAEEESS